MSNEFLRRYEEAQKSKRKRKDEEPSSKQLAIRLPMDVYRKLEELAEMKSEPISRTAIKALRFALELPE